MKSRKNYFRSRRERLRRRHMCTRCGENPARTGHADCESCAEIKKAKRSVDPRHAIKQSEKAKEKLALLELARAQLMRRFESVA